MERKGKSLRDALQTVSTELGHACDYSVADVAIAATKCKMQSSCRCEYMWLISPRLSRTAPERASLAPISFSVRINVVLLAFQLSLYLTQPKPLTVWYIYGMACDITSCHSGVLLRCGCLGW